MKKLVVIVLVLALASVANAGVGFVAYNAAGNTPLPVDSGKVWVWPGDVVTIKLIVSGNTSAGFDIGVIDDGPSFGTASDLWVNPGLSTMAQPGYIENSNAQGGAGGALIAFWSYMTSGTVLPAGSTLASFKYTVDSMQPVMLEMPIACSPAGTYWSALDGTSYEYGNSTAGFGGGIVPIDGVTLAIYVPEPMTLGLLGLGGLFIRRRLA